MWERRTELIWTFALPSWPCTDRLWTVTVSLFSVTYCLIDETDQVAYIPHTHTSIACPVTRLSSFCVNNGAGSHAWLYFFSSPLCFAHFLHVTFHSACSIRIFIFFFTPVTLLYSTAAELTIYPSSIFPSLFFVGRLLNIRRGKRKESRDVTTLQGEQVLTLSKCRGVPNNTLSPLKLGSYPKVFASPALAVGKLFNNFRVRTHHFVNNWIRKSAQMCSQYSEFVRVVSIAW